MTYKKLTFIAAILIGGISTSQAQTGYKYSVDLNAVKEDRLTVTLEPPKISTATTTFYLPKIVPGTYMYSNYGRFVHNLKALDKAGKELVTKQTTENSWEIANATALSKIVYDVEDTWDADVKEQVYPMAGTNIEQGKNFVFNSSGVFGYFDKMKDRQFELRFTKPQGFYGSTGLVPVASTSTTDVYKLDNADHLYDSPIMFNVPDTTTIKVGGADVLVSVYSPNKLVKSAYIASHLEKLLSATHKYLGGSLPVKKYAFIYHFKEGTPWQLYGAWEHSYSSFYSLNEMPQEEGIAGWVDMSAHEFFHIVTPLTIASKEVKKFDFNDPVLSRHLWLYEGSTEYASLHMQVKYGLNTPEEFFKKLSEKITISRLQMNDTLSFTELSKESAGKWKDQYGNVYQKGALISAALDLYLLKLSGGKMDLTALKAVLGKKYGADKYFEDDKLFDEITAMTFPEIRKFFADYVEGGKPIPYDQFFGYAGVKHIPQTPIMRPTLGDVILQLNAEGNIYVANTDRANEFGKAFGYQVGDEWVSFNGKPITAANANTLLTDFTTNSKTGDVLTITVNRKNAAAIKEVVTLSKPLQFTQSMDLNRIMFAPDATPEQIAIRKAWLGPLGVK